MKNQAAQAKARLLAKMNALVNVYEQSCKVSDQMNMISLNHDVAIVEKLTLTQAYLLEKSILKAEHYVPNKNPNLDWGPVVVSPSNYASFIPNYVNTVNDDLYSTYCAWAD